jgi:hypothetical protein
MLLQQITQFNSLSTYVLPNIDQGWRNFEGACPNCLQPFEELLSRAVENFEEQNNSFETSVIIINYCIVIVHGVITFNF